MLEPSNLNLLLIDAPVGRHLAQLHRDRTARDNAVIRFVEEGLRRGNGVVAVTSDNEADRILDRLTRDRLEPERFRRSGQLVIHDAGVILGQFMKGGMPQWPAFRRTMGSIMEKVQTLGFSTSRVYGDMVDILWQEGQVQAAIRLEEMWNDFGRLYPFSFFCSYMFDGPERIDAGGQPLPESYADILLDQDDEVSGDALTNVIRDIFGASGPGNIDSDGHGGESTLEDTDHAVLWILRNRRTRFVEVLNWIRSAHPDPLGKMTHRSPGKQTRPRKTPQA